MGERERVGEREWERETESGVREETMWHMFKGG